MKILMATMGLDIGGAETHVVELSKELKKQGYDIIVASNGGVYEKELAEAGIKHYHAPLNQRNILKMARSYFILKKVIKKGKSRYRSFSCQNPQLCLWSSEKTHEGQIYVRDFCPLGILHRYGSEIYFQLGPESSCSQR